MTEKKKKADFVYSHSGSFKPLDGEMRLELEKHKYLKGVLPRIESLKNEIEQDINEDVNKKEVFEFLKNSRSNYKNITFEHEDGEIYPKEIEPPQITYIPPAEPHIIITDWYENDYDWYKMREIIESFAEESFLCYEMGLWYSSLASAINRCEYALKYEVLRKRFKIDKFEAEKLSLDKKFSLGSFTFNKKYLDEINLEELHDKIKYLNDIRISLYHFSPEKNKKISSQGEIDVERHSPLSDEFGVPVIAYRVYSIMKKLLSKLYNRNKAIKFFEEGISEWITMRRLKKEDLKK